MKTKLLKKDRLKFVKEAKELFIRLGFQPIPEDLPHAREGSLRIMTNYGVYLVHEPDADFGYCSINGRFTDTSHFKSFGGQTCIDINPYSGKWNILHSDPQATLDEFARRMTWVNARAIRPGEMDEQDARDAAKLKADLAEWKAWEGAQ
jgi:hypothetical protein